MSKPTEETIRFLLSDTAEHAREWIEEQLLQIAKLENLHVAHVSITDMEIWDGLARAQVEGIGRGWTDTIGDVNVGADDLVEILYNPESLADKADKARAAKLEEEKRKNAKRKQEQEAQKLARDQAEYLRLKQKFGDI